MKTNLVRITPTAAVVTALGPSACSAGAENKPAGNTQAVSTTQDANKNTPSPGNVAAVNNGGGANTTTNSDDSGNKSGSRDTGDSDNKPCIGNPNVSSSSSVVTLNEYYDTINITGSGNQVTFESADKAILSGGSGVVVGQELGDMEIISGDSNITVADDLDGITINGSGNTVSSQDVEKKKDTGSDNTISWAQSWSSMTAP